MASDRKRGRPKGTGINDQETLFKIASLIAANPKMKRTTAIKRAGITNASVIRRLRDKYQEQEHILLAEIAAANDKAKRKPADAAGKTDSAKKGKPAHPAGASSSAPRGATAHGVTEEAIAGRQQSKAGGAAQGPAVDPLAAIFDGLSIETLVTQFIGHVLGIDAKDIENSPVTAMIRQQAQLADLVLPLLLSQFANQRAAAKAA